MGSYKKKLFIVLLLFLLISCFVCSSVNATSPDNYDVDPIYLMREQQEMLATVGINYLEQYGNSAVKSSFMNNINNSNYYCLWTVNQLNDNPSIRIVCYFIPYKVNWHVYGNLLTDFEESYFDDSFLVYPSSGYQFNASDIGVNSITRFVIYPYNTSAYYEAYTNKIFLPSGLIMYNNVVVSNYRNGIIPSANPWVMLQNAINNNTEAVEDTTQAVNNLRNDFNEEESDNDYDFPTSNPTSDPTTSGIDNIFNMFYMRINSWNALGINVPIPFTGKSFTINPDITENIINGWTPSTQIATVFKTLLSGVWYYLLGRYIVKDVQHYVDGLQTGDILTKSDTNIKTEML